MTTIVTADKLVTALAQRVNAGADTSVSGPNKQLKDAMVAKNFFDGSGGGGGGGGGLKMEFAHAAMGLRSGVTSSKIARVIPLSVRTSSSTDTENPSDPIMNNYEFDTASTANALGAWSRNNSRFTFAKRCFAVINARMHVVVQVLNPLANSADNVTACLAVGNTTTNPNGTFTGAAVDRAYAPDAWAQSGLAWCSGETTLTRWFEPNDFVDFKYLLCTSNGTSLLAYYGSINKIESSAEISAFTGIQ